MKLFGREFKFNNNKVYHAGDKPTPSEIGAASASHTHNYAGSSSAGGAANSANTLATARTINGTSFNGSANITTANWGTARTLTVGNTGKSVNGSGNVTWSLNEIGAMQGSTVSATTAATAGWYRIAQTTSTDQANVTGTFTITAACSGNHSSTILMSGISYGVNPTIQQLSHTQYSATGISQARIVYHTTYSGNRAYLEVYVPTAAARTITVQLSANAGWTLVTPSTAGSIPSGYTNKAITLASDRIVSNVTGALSGNASTSTKATQDSAGQQINKTYIKGLSVSGRTITYTKGDGTTGTITTQDTNTTYSTGTASALGLTKLYTGTGTATDGTMTQAAIKTALDGKAASSHTHNYAGSSSAGGAANSANTLATARTINGTSFNGSANITTANWGTARTLTIGNTGKSVNGSGNVSWSLSEIGAFSSGGGDVGGNIHLTPNNAGITGVCGGGTDRWGIIGGGADDNGYLEINTKDNGNEPIYVRQYDSNGLVRTAALLDGGGATSFPGKTSAPIFNIANSPGSQNNAIFGGSGDRADWNVHNLVIKSHWGIGFRDYQDVCRIVFDTRSGNINTRGLLYSEGGISCTAWGHFNGSISADGGATIGSHTYINAMSVGDKITGETKFSKDGAWYDPWSGVGCAIKTHGNIAVTGIVRATDHMEINGTPISIQSSAPGCGGVWIQI